MDDVIAYLASKSVRVHPGPGSEVLVHCLFCPDGDPKGRGKMYVNADSWLYDCKRCGTRGNRKTLMRHFGDEDKVEYLPGLNPAMRRKVLAEAAQVAAEMLENNPRILASLKSRGLSMQTIVDAQLGFVPASWSLSGILRSSNTVADVIASGLMTDKGQDFFSNRITIPYFSHGEVIQLRGKEPGGKYLTPANDGVRLFNADRLRDAQDVILVEGEFDALVLQQNLELAEDARLRATAVVGIPGAEALPVGFQSYFEHARRVYLALDPDETGIRAALRIKDMLGSKARIVRLPEDLPKCDWSEFFGRGKTWRDVVPLLTTADAEGRRLWTIGDAETAWRRVEEEIGGIKLGIPELDGALSPGLKPGQVMIPLAKTGVGKSVPCFTNVDTPIGIRRWGDLQVGDQVWGSDGKPTTIIGTFPQGDLESWKISFSDGTSVLASADHIWRVAYRSGRQREWTWADLTTRQILDGGLRAGHNGVEWKYRIPMTEPVRYPHADLPVEPYTLGALIANGGMAHHSVILTTPDRDVIARVAQHHAVTDYSHHAPQGCPRWYLPKMMQKIKALGLDKLSVDKFIPGQYLRAGVDQRIALLQGLLDGDGSSRVNDRRRAVSYFSSSKQLTADVTQLVQSLGGTAMVRWHRSGTEGVISIMLPEGISPFGTPRKNAAPAMRNRHVPHRAIVGIEPTGVIEPQMCIAVDAPDSLYLAGTEFHVTHNTNFLCNVAWYTRERPVLYVTLEMTRAEIYERLRRIALFWHPMATDDEIREHYRLLRIVDQNRLKEGDLARLVEEFGEEVGVAPHLAFVDYLGYYAKGVRGTGLYEKTTNAVMSLKEDAKSAMVALITPHQVNRSADDGKPLDMDDARDSGAVEETADHVLSLYSPADAATRSEAGRPLNATVRYQILKNRNGSKGAAYNLTFSHASLVLVPQGTKASQVVDEENRLIWRGEDYASVLRARRGQTNRERQLSLVV